jgi:hypothetical protein
MRTIGRVACSVNRTYKTRILPSHHPIPARRRASIDGPRNLAIRC